MDKILTIKEKILYFIEKQGISKEEFYRNTGISASNFKGVGLKSEIGGEKIVKILTIYPEINADWLLRNDQKMTNSKSKNNVTIKNGDIIGDKNGDKPKVKEMSPFKNESSVLADSNSDFGKIMSKLKFAENVHFSEQGAPFYDLPVSAGMVEELVAASELPTGFISMPGVNCDAYFPIIGCSFGSFIEAGDIIGINFLNSWEILDPDCIYLIITHDQRMLKRLIKHPTDSTLLICVSPNYREFTIDKFTIRYIMKVTFKGKPI
jgi:hypothetical protein